jgi:hypothetical protein
MKALSILLFSLILSTPALAEDGSTWKEVSKILDTGEEVVILPLQSEIPLDLQEQPPPQPELHFSGAQVEHTSTAQAMLALPTISVGEQGIISPFFALNGQSDGTRQGLTLSVEGGISLLVGELVQLQFSIEEMIHPLPITSFKMNAVFRF